MTAARPAVGAVVARPSLCRPSTAPLVAPVVAPALAVAPNSPYRRSAPLEVCCLHRSVVEGALPSRSLKRVPSQRATRPWRLSRHAMCAQVVLLALVRRGSGAGAARSTIAYTAVIDMMHSLEHVQMYRILDRQRGQPFEPCRSRRLHVQVTGP